MSSSPLPSPRLAPGGRSAFLLFAFGLAAAVCGCRGPGSAPRARTHETLEHRVMVGYQGWFRTPDDGAGMGWAHYQQSGTTQFGPGHLSVDYWPEVGELPAASQVATSFRHADGSVARVFSSHDPAVVDLHFRWMRDYGIDGAFVQRFSAPIIGDDAPSQTRRASTDHVLRTVIGAAERYGRSFAVMYDLSGQHAGQMDRVIADWRHCVDDLSVRRSSAAQRHRGRPVVAVWGIGFDDGREYTLAEIARLIDFLKHDPVYGGNTVMLGVPTWWRERSADAVASEELHAVLRQADIISPWTPGRYQDIGGVEAYAERLWERDLAWCRDQGLDYMPVVFPGFSWRNLKGASGGISRNDGRFLWAQYRELSRRGVSMIYQAMFDEMDEGTQIFKATNTPPLGAFFETYQPMPADYYLRLVGTATDYVHRAAVLPERIPGWKQFPDLTRLLRRRDDAEYAFARVSYAAQRSFFAIADALVAAGDGWGDVPGGQARVRATGDWRWRYLWSGDPAASVTWRLTVPRAGDYTVAVRYPADPNGDHATTARLRLRQDGAILAEHRLNLREHALQWLSLPGVVRLNANAPLELVLDQDAATGPLVLFEPRLTAASR